MSSVDATVTGYWPYNPSSGGSNALMEGGTRDCKGRVIHTLEQHMNDPASHPYVTVAGDFTIWPDGQRLQFEQWPDLVFRVTDTGGNFFDSKKTKKQYRTIGQEPFDVAVNSSKTPVNRNQLVTIMDGDAFSGSIDYARLQAYGVRGPFDGGTDTGGTNDFGSLFADLGTVGDDSNSSMVGIGAVVMGAVVVFLLVGG